jgi:hypothetical protein
MINPGEFNEKINVLSISNSNNVYLWLINTSIWSKVEVTTKNNIFSNVGFGAKSIKFIIRKRDLTLHNALKWNDKHCFLTDIIEIDRMYYEITAALIEPKTCTVERTGAPVLDSLNRPIYSNSNLLTFPGCLTEKYIRHTQDSPMTEIESRYVLVIPKVIDLIDGELVSIDGISYEVLLSHTLDEYKNEYEISARRNS